MSNLSGFIVSEKNKKFLIRIKVRVESILKFDDICEDDIQSLIEDLASIQLQKEDKRHDVKFIPEVKEEEKAKVLAILEKRTIEKSPDPVVIPFYFIVSDSLGSKIGKLKVDATDKEDAKRKAIVAAGTKFKGKQINLKIE